MKNRITGLRAKSKGTPRSTTRKAQRTVRGTGATSKSGVNPAKRATVGVRVGGTNGRGAKRRK